MREKLRLFSWNVNGIRAAYKKGLLEWVREASPDILCVQETKASPEQLPKDLLEPQGYHAFWDKADKKGYSGVGVYTRTPPAAVHTGMGISRFDSEGRILRLDFDRFVLFNVYFPNGKKNQERLQFKLDFYDAFLDHIEKLRRTGASIVFCGDVNTAHKETDLARPKENEKVSGFLPIEREWIDRVVAAGYLDTFRLFCSDAGRYSWWDQKTRARERNIGWRIDYVFVCGAMRAQVKDAWILEEVMGSDHCPIGVDLEI
ncbi:MAG: exodeoxyribonuclease III [Thermodesulfobacteriota bacterium]